MTDVEWNQSTICSQIPILSMVYTTGLLSTTKKYNPSGVKYKGEVKVGILAPQVTDIDDWLTF